MRLKTFIVIIRCLIVIDAKKNLKTNETPMKKTLLNLLKLIGMTFFFALAGATAAKGFHMPNSSAADLCFGAAMLFAICGCWITILN